jgi:thiol-disulfide isomerase/thioredoxin
MSDAGDLERDDAGGGTLRTMLLVVLFVAGVALVARVVRPPSHPLVGKAAPEFSLATLDTEGGATTLQGAGTGTGRIVLSELRGKPVLLDFWATWCGPCQAESPILDGVARRMKDRGLVVVGVDTNDSPLAARNWVRQHGISYPIVSDEDGTLSRSYGVANLPTLVLLAKDGTVKAVRVGLTDAGELEQLVQKEL